MACRRKSAPSVAGAVAAHADTEAEQHAGRSKNLVSLLVFRAGSRAEAVPLSADHAARGDRLQEDRALQRPPHGAYRGQLMPLVCTSGEFKINARGCAAAAGVLRRPPLHGASWSTRSSTSSRTSSILRSAATAPACWSGWCAARLPKSSMSVTSCRSPMRTGSEARTCGTRIRNAKLLLVDDFGVLPQHAAPVLKAAGYQVTAVSSAQEALATQNKGQRFDALVTDSTCPRWTSLRSPRPSAASPSSAKSR